MQIDVCMGPNPETKNSKWSTLFQLLFIVAMIVLNIFNWLCIFVPDGTFSSHKRQMVIPHVTHAVDRQG